MWVSRSKNLGMARRVLRSHKKIRIEDPVETKQEMSAVSGKDQPARLEKEVQAEVQKPSTSQDVQEVLSLMEVDDGSDTASGETELSDRELDERLVRDLVGTTVASGGGHDFGRQDDNYLLSWTRENPGSHVRGAIEVYGDKDNVDFQDTVILPDTAHPDYDEKFHKLQQALLRREYKVNQQRFKVLVSQGFTAPFALVSQQRKELQSLFVPVG